uniref:Chromosome 18 open reading frame 25 n=1 Tax=Neogobius melanostomus TaxID=47308 RepID=A0A8C6UAA2_9GOBI
MKMADSGKTDEFVDAECPTECLDEANAAAGQEEQEEECRSETSTSITSTQREKEGDSLLQTESEQSLLSMPCLMKELRRDSAGSQQASSGGDKAVSSRAYESDSSNPCMLSPSSSGHLADSDTLSSGDEVADAPVGEDEDNMEALLDSEQTADKPTSSTTGVRKSRRSRSESDAPSNAMAAKKNRCQTTTDAATGQEKQTNGKVGKVKGHRSQKHKERMRLLRQKREAAARKKYNLLQDSSTSDSEVTCDSSTSSSDDDDETSGGSKTIKTDIPGNAEAQLLHKESSQHKGQISITSSDSEVEIVDVQEKARCSHPYGGVIKSLSSWKENPVNQITSTNQSQLWTSVSPQPNWVSPPEVVDLTLDEETGHKYLL